jgi:hypothetical protein
MEHFGSTVKFHLEECFCFSRFIQHFDYVLFTGRKCVTLEKFQCHVSPPYIFSRFLKTFTPIIALLRLESVRRHQVNTLYGSFFEFIAVCTVFTITFLEGPLFWPKTPKNLNLLYKLKLTFYRFALEDFFLEIAFRIMKNYRFCKYQTLPVPASVKFHGIAPGVRVSKRRENSMEERIDI